MSKKPTPSSKRRVSQPHDLTFRRLLDAPENARIILADHLPPDIVQRLAPDPPQHLEGSFVDAALRGSQTDRLFQIKLTDGQPLLVYVLCEHKSYLDRRTPLQIARYMINIWEHYLTQHPDQQTCPHIIPLVFYHGQQAWTIPTSVFDLLEEDDSLTPYSRSLRYLLRNFSTLTPDELSSDVGIRAVLWTMEMIPRQAEITDAALRQFILERLQDTRGHHVLQTLLEEYILHTVERDLTVLEPAPITDNTGKDTTPMGMTLAQQLLDRGKTEGIAEGIAEGEAKGKAEGKADALLQLLRQRFGDIPQQYARATQKASVKQLDQWLATVLTAQTLDDLFKAQR